MWPEQDIAKIERINRLSKRDRVRYEQLYRQGGMVDMEMLSLFEYLQIDRNSEWGGALDYIASQVNRFLSGDVRYVSETNIEPQKDTVRIPFPRDDFEAMTGRRPVYVVGRKFTERAYFRDVDNISLDANNPTLQIRTLLEWVGDENGVFSDFIKQASVIRDLYANDFPVTLWNSMFGRDAYFDRSRSEADFARRTQQIDNIPVLAMTLQAETVYYPEFGNPVPDVHAGFKLVQLFNGNYDIVLLGDYGERMHVEENLDLYGMDLTLRNLIPIMNGALDFYGPEGNGRFILP